jgi:hypothetical protein
MSIVTDNFKPVVIYNCNKQEIIAVFAAASLAVKYLFTDGLKKRDSTIRNALARKSKIQQTIFNFPVAIRFANEYQITLLEGDLYKIFNNYQQPNKARMKGFSDNAESFKKEFIKKVERFNIEKNRIKNFQPCP